MRVRAAVAAVLSAVLTTATLGAESRPIDTDRSTLTVLVFKSGLFSAFADDHVIRAPIAAGSLSAEAPLSVEIGVRSGSLTVLDPKLSADKRAEVQTRMLGAEVLDSVRFPDIAFASTTIEPSGGDRWRVTGRLTVHGTTMPATFSVTRQDGRYRGTVSLKQSDFGIKPISIGGGVVKVKDEITIEFDVVAQK
jgi:hypothetical protein